MARSVSLAGATALVTGGAGLVGSHIVDQLVERGAKEIRVLDNFVRGTRANLAGADASGLLTVIEGDIRDPKVVADALSGCDCVFHQAAIRITQCASEPRECLEVLVDGTFNVLEAAVAQGVKKVVAASSASVYGQADTFPTTEEHHLYNNRTLYGAAKVANEQMLRSFNEMHGLDYVALRYFNIYGPRMDIFGVYTEVLIRWLDCFDRGERPKIFGDGSHTMDFVFIKDIARANLLAMEADVSDEVYNVAAEIEVSLSQLLDATRAAAGSSLEPEFLPERKVNPVKRRLGSVAKIQRDLGFEPSYSLEQGLQELVAWRKAAISSS